MKLYFCLLHLGVALVSMLSAQVVSVRVLNDDFAQAIPYTEPINGFPSATPAANSYRTISPSVPVGRSFQRRFLITNISSDELRINTQVDNANFTVSGGNASLGPNKTADLVVTFAPIATGSTTGIVRINSNSSSGQPFLFEYAGTAPSRAATLTSPVGALVSYLAAPSAAEGTIFSGNIGTTIRSENFIVRNIGDVPMTIRISVSNGLRRVGQNVDIPLAVNATTSVQVELPNTDQTGEFDGQLAIVAQPTGGESALILGIYNLRAIVESAPAISLEQVFGNGSTFDLVTPVGVGFGNVEVGTTQFLTYRITNSGSEPLIISATDITGDDDGFWSTTLAPQTLAPQTSADFTITFSPTGGITSQAQLTISAAGLEPTVLNLSGRNVFARLSVLDPATNQLLTLDSALTLAVGESISLPVRLQNFANGSAGQAPLRITRIIGEGNLARLFEITTLPLPAFIAPNGFHDTTVTIRLLEWSPNPGTLALDADANIDTVKTNSDFLEIHVAPGQNLSRSVTISDNDFVTVQFRADDAIAANASEVTLFVSDDLINWSPRGSINLFAPGQTISLPTDGYDPIQRRKRFFQTQITALKSNE